MHYNVAMPLKINLKSLMLYTLCAAAMAFANFAVKGVPLSIGIYFAMLLCGTHILLTPALYILASAVHLDLALSLLSLFEGAFLALIVFLYRRTNRKMRIEAAVYLIIALSPYVIFAPWKGIGEVITDNEYILRGGAAAVAIALTYFCFKSVYALMFRLQRCRLREDELLSLAVTYAVTGTGLFTVCGEALYICFCALIISLSVRLARSPVALIVAIVLALPASAYTLALEPLTMYVVISTAALLFSNAGRFAACGVTGICSAAYMYYAGGFDCEIPFIVLRAIVLFLAVFAASLPSDKKLKELKMRLLVTDVLPDTAVARSRRRTGERLYRISEVFREIECAFLALDEDVDDRAARMRMLDDLKEKCCKTCERAKRCGYSDVYTGFAKLIDAGCAKGKVNLIDLPSEITSDCSRPADVLVRLNSLLAEYRRFMVDAENAKSGRRLLAEQAHGVAEVMKSCAVELGHTQILRETEESVKKALSSQGISCPEIYVDGDNGEVFAVAMGKTNVKAVAACLTKELGRRYCLKDKLTYDDEKSCLVFGAPPRLDAAFGMAYAIKKGERVSGDTHSVIRINDRKFLMALSDGMGSGEYARKVSEAAISLIEAFYRAEMPEDTVLKTINKLLSFNRDERFTCIDIAAVNLDSGRADFVKIGSPAGIIIREGGIKVLESTSLPLGILENLRPAVCTEILKSGDICVFMSDGITSAFPSATDLYEFLQELKPLNPQNLADKILAAALARMNNAVTDDMTVLCTRIFDNDI